MVLALWTTACVVDDARAPDDPVSPLPTVTIGDLVSGDVGVGRHRIAPLVVISGPTVDGQRVYVQDPNTGAGMEVRRGGTLRTWPPVVGTPVELDAYVAVTDPPVAWIDADADVDVQGPATSFFVVAEEPEDPAPWTLARFGEVIVTSTPDPAGRADTSLGRPLDDRFGVGLPQRGNVGEMIALVTGEGALALRSDDDWVGPRADTPPVRASVFEILGGLHPEGTEVEIAVLQVAPWSRGNRFTAVQDAAGLGLWVDAEAWGDGVGEPGEVGVWRGEVRSYGPAYVLRTWTPRVVTSAASPKVVDEGLHGALVSRVVSQIGPVDAGGDRDTKEGWRLDDRFRDLDDLPDSAVVVGVVDLLTDPRRLAVVAASPVPDTGTPGDTGDSAAR